MTEPTKSRGGRFWPAAARGLVVVLVGAFAAAAGQGGGLPAPAAPAGGATAESGAKPQAPDITFVEEDEMPAPGKAAPPKSPFAAGESAAGRKDAVPGYLELSSGLKVPGFIYTTRAKRLKIYNLAREVYEYVPAAALARIEAIEEWARTDPEWRFKEAGNPEKVTTGRSYPARSLAWRLTLRNGHQITGHILGQPLYVEHNGKAERFLLHQRDKGPMGTALADLVYIRHVEFGPEAYNQAVDELKAKAEAAARPPAPRPAAAAP